MHASYIWPISDKAISRFLVFSVCRTTIYTLLLLGLWVSLARPLKGQQRHTHVSSDLEWSQEMLNAKPFVVDTAALRVASPAELNQLGQWSEIIQWPHTPVSAANLPDGRILTFASNGEEAWPAGQDEFTYAAAWDPLSGSFKMVPHNTHDMFCAELVLTDTGKLHVAGGRNSVPTTSLFDFESDTWVDAGDMETGRWYPTSVAMPNGTVFTALGSGGTPGFGPIPELWTEGSGWSEMNGIDMNFPIIYQEGWDSSSWPFLFISSNGELFHAGPTNRMHTISLAGEGSMRSLGTSDKGWYGKRGANVMYEENKIMIIGGSAYHPEEVKNVGSNQAISIDISTGKPVITPLPSMAHARITHNVVLLPNGQILIVGGQTEGTGDDNSVLTPELYDPETGTWTELADMSVPRNYHSTALLMTDGRVWSGGGGFCTTECPAITHSDAQLFSPPYLFDASGNEAVRPVVNQAPESVQNGEVFTVNASPGMTRFTWIKMSAITHQMNTDLRRLYADVNEVTPGTYEINAHENPNVLTPGYWMLFAVDADGVPSEAAVIQVTTGGIPELAHPGPQFGVEGELVSLYLSAFDNDPLTYAASGLPPGLSIDAITGEVKGVVAEQAIGVYPVTITASDGVNQAAAEFDWTIGTSQGEVGQVTTEQVDPEEWFTVELQNEYMAPVVVMGPLTHNDEAPAIARVRNVTPTSFEYQLDEGELQDGIHGSETVSYLVLEAGVHTIADGRTVQAGITDVSSDSQRVAFNTDFDDVPVLLTQVGSVNEDETAAARILAVSEYGFDTRLQEEDASDNVHAAETVFWVALKEGGSPGDNGIAAGRHTYASNETAIALNGVYAVDSPFFAAIQSTPDTIAVSLRQQTIEGSTVNVHLDSALPPDTPLEGELGYVMFDTAGDFPFKPNDIPPILLANPGNQSGTEGQVVYREIQVEQDNGNPLTFSATGLPNGVTLDEVNGVLAGGLASDSEGLSTVTIQATDGISEGTISFDWLIYGAPGEWVDYTDDSAVAVQVNSVPLNDSEEKDMAVGDLNNDGWDDIVVVRKEPFMGQEPSPDLLLMNEQGTLVDRTSTLAPGFAANPTIARDVLIEDFDGDGWKDVVIANTFGDQPAFYRNLGESDGTWLGLADESQERLPELDSGSLQHCAVTAGDVNGDGFPDLYFANYVLDGMVEDVLFINDGKGFFTDEGRERLGDLIQVSFGTQGSIIDMDGDGDNDIVKLSAKRPVDPFGADGIFVLYNDGTGTFSDWSSVPSNQAYMYAIGDFNNDDAYDFYIVDDALDYVQLSNNVVPDTDVSFSKETLAWVRTAGHGANLGMADLDHDGDLDIGVADVDTSFPPCESDGFRAFLLLENRDVGSGSFTDPFGAEDKPWSRNIYDFGFIDINNDGNTDIFTAECSGYGVFTSTQEPINFAPVLQPMEDVEHTVEDTVSVFVSATDGNADPIEYAATSLPAGLALNGTEISGILTEADIYTVLITATDGKGGADSTEFVWIVNQKPEVNVPPVLVELDDQLHMVGDSVSVQVSATDANADTLTYTATGLPDGLALEGTDISGMPTVADTFDVRIVVADGKGGNDTMTFNWIIEGEPVDTYTERPPGIPEAFAIASIYPNPFARTANIEYQLPEESSVRIEIFSITGQRIRILEDLPSQPPGFWKTTWNGTYADGRPVATGLYLIRLKAGPFTETRTVVLIK